MKNRILKNKLRFSAVFFSFLSLTLLLVVSCDMDPVSTPDSDLILNEAVANEFLKTKKKFIDICHVPPGNPDKPQKITVDFNAAMHHMNNHKGDFFHHGFFGEDCKASKIDPIDPRDPRDPRKPKKPGDKGDKAP